MKFRVERDVLAEAVTWAARGLPNRPPVPVLAGVLLEASDEGTLTLSAFDYEVSARITVAADAPRAGAISRAEVESTDSRFCSMWRATLCAAGVSRP